MSDDPLVQALHAAISRRSWNAVEQVANAIRDDNRIQWPNRKLLTGAQIKAEAALHPNAVSLKGDGRIT
jgi:hypothetical protein